ncbi:Bgt-55142 [Blumeria graminis f. sp. tritici]|uniref:Bgt-55142 n=2 Tax=Blumeria graminis f. sp. tritici TaxID=62690 RepID=A0A9X9QCJ4_BLUGR|nr:putative secreted effector protein [Blumeria graminis f. sp. tritici 96224]VDB85931.1 Bgt-55142 [Blumeria graminis f. sp. tritici]
MRLLGTLAAVPCVFSVYVAGEHGYLCSDAEGTTNTTYDQALVEKSVTDACLPDSELSAAELAANVEAKKYPQVWVNSEDYGFNETVLLWKYQGNSSESLEEVDVLVFTNKSCDILGLLQTSDDQYTICKDAKEQNAKKIMQETLSKKAQPGIFSDNNEDNGNIEYSSDYDNEDETQALYAVPRGDGPPNSSNSDGSKRNLKNSSSSKDVIGSFISSKSFRRSGSQRGSPGNSLGPPSRAEAAGGPPPRPGSSMGPPRGPGGPPPRPGSSMGPPQGPGGPSPRPGSSMGPPQGPGSSMGPPQGPGSSMGPPQGYGGQSQGYQQPQGASAEIPYAKLSYAQRQYRNRQNLNPDNTWLGQYGEYFFQDIQNPDK